MCLSKRVLRGRIYPCSVEAKFHSLLIHNPWEWDGLYWEKQFSPLCSGLFSIRIFFYFSETDEPMESLFFSCRWDFPTQNWPQKWEEVGLRIRLFTLLSSRRKGKLGEKYIRDWKFRSVTEIPRKGRRRNGTLVAEKGIACMLKERKVGAEFRATIAPNHEMREHDFGRRPPGRLDTGN